MTVVVHHTRPAMATLFEVVLLGDDQQHLAAVAEAALDEATRVERLLSRHDPRSEIARLNREAAHAAVIVDRELLGLMQLCEQYATRTGGYFDVAAASASFSDVVLDPDKRTVRYANPAVVLDFGALGKGYALDRAAELVRNFGIQQAFLHGGTSSILAVGCGANGKPWPVGIRNPWGAHDTSELTQIGLADQGYSCSAVFSAGGAVSDIVDPRHRAALTSQAACVVVAPSAIEAEILSTALLAMGMTRAQAYTESAGSGLCVGWLANAEQPSINWFSAVP
jgi:thiamine biosynthesis lipoprotein